MTATAADAPKAAQDVDWRERQLPGREERSLNRQFWSVKVSLNVALELGTTNFELNSCARAAGTLMASITLRHEDCVHQ